MRSLDQRVLDRSAVPAQGAFGEERGAELNVGPRSRYEVGELRGFLVVHLPVVRCRAFEGVSTASSVATAEAALRVVRPSVIASCESAETVTLVRR